MTSTLTLGPEHQRLEGHTVRDIVEHDPAQVNEVWCRKIFRQLLQSLELQYAMHMPHRAITPDTVVFHENGEPLLVASDLTVAESEQDEAADLAALARVVHYAITRELAPAGPLRGRSLDGYSDSLITAVDRCMAPDPAERPRSIDELRHILGIVTLGPAMPMGAPIAPVAPAAPTAPMAPVAPAAVQPRVADLAPAAAAAAFAPTPSPAAAAAAADMPPSFMRDPGTARPGAGLTRWQRWAVAAGGGAVLLAVALALFAELRDSGSYDHIVLSLPQSGDQSGEHARADKAVPPAQDRLAAQDDARQPDAGAPALPPAASQPANQPADQAVVGNAALLPSAAPAAPNNVAATATRSNKASAVAATPGVATPGVATPGATYRLQIQPWGVIYVDGVDRGVSPPIKRLALTPGRHTIRIANPNFHDRVLEVETSAGSGQIAINFSDEPR